MDYDLDIYGQQPRLRIYTQICFLFPVLDGSSKPAIIDTLITGLDRLAASFPWLAGDVVNGGLEEGSSGTFKIKILNILPRLVVKDLTQDSSMPTMDDLRDAKFPSRMLDESTIAPLRTLPRKSDDTARDFPVFLVQANFIVGGLILCFVGEHQAMDMIGQGQIMRLFSKACRDDPFTSEELSSGNLDRRKLLSLLDEPREERSKRVEELPQSSVAVDRPERTPTPKASWAYFIFGSSSLAALKTLATETLPDPSMFVSTDDAISAIVWQSIIRARLGRLGPTALSTFSRNVDMRNYLGISPNYSGVLVGRTHHTYTLQRLVNEPLGVVASHLRSALDPETSHLREETLALAKALSRASDKNTVNLAPPKNLSADLTFSSWAKIDLYQLGFNLGLGSPESVRRPQFDAIEGLQYLMPRAPTGEMALLVCLRDDDMERLRMDAVFSKYATYVG